MITPVNILLKEALLLITIFLLGHSFHLFISTSGVSPSVLTNFSLIYKLFNHIHFAKRFEKEKNNSRNTWKLIFLLLKQGLNLVVRFQRVILIIKTLFLIQIFTPCVLPQSRNMNFFPLFQVYPVKKTLIMIQLTVSLSRKLFCQSPNH